MDIADTEQHGARIRALDESWRAAAARRDLDGMMAIYAPDAEELLPDLPAIVGRDSIRAFYQQLFRECPRFAHDFEPHDISVARSGDLAVVRGTYRFTPDTANPKTASAGKFVGIWRQVDGDWRLQINISNGDPPSGTTRPLSR
jgi:uncharacterized protein (TIGR02246 family)